MTDPDSPPPGPLHRQWRSMAFVFVGGMIGTLVRYAAERGFPAGAADWPWATFAVNCAGTFVLGALIAALTTLGSDSGWRLRTRLLVGVGFCGSLTTYSAFALESDRLLSHGSVVLGAGYVVATVLAGSVFAAMGYLGGRALGDRMSRR